MTTIPAFQHHEIPTEEIDRRERVNAPLGAALRELTEATIRADVDDDVLAWATERMAEITARLQERQLAGAFGVHFNHEGRSWHWGNAAIGLRNPVAPPMQVLTGEDGVVRADLDLLSRYEGPPGHVHGGVTALLLDHLMGVTASAGNARPTMTGTLTLRYRRLTRLGRVHLEGRIIGEERAKVFVGATLSDEDGVTVEADGVFVVPRWAR